MAKKARSIILATCGGDKRGGAKIGRKGGKYFVDSMASTRGPRGKKQTTRKYMRSRGEAEETYRQFCTFRSFSGLGLSEDGKHCRDGSGAFVPVSQCKGPVGRDAGGRFVSIKDL